MTPLFFATADDLLPVFEDNESKRMIHDTLCGHLDVPNINSFKSGAELPTLRQAAPYESSSELPAYIITEASQQVRLREVFQQGGKRCWAVDQLQNPDSTVLWHGGMYADCVLLNGRVATAYKSKYAMSLQRAFETAIKRRFVRIQSYFVGPHAGHLLDSGYRLTFGASSPSDYDLRRPGLTDPSTQAR